MKKKIILIAGIVLLVFSFGACKSTAKAKPKGLKGVPDFVNEAFLSASEDVLIGIGTYKTGGDPSKISTAKPYAETRARADIARQLQSIIENMITDYQANSELDPKAAISFQENVTRALSRATLNGSKTIQMGEEKGVLWIVMEYSKSLAAADFQAAQAAAKLAVPAAAAFNALERMDKQFDKMAGGGPTENPLLD